MIRTDGVSLSVVVDERLVAQRQSKRKRRQPPPSMYFDDNRHEIREKHVFIDPNRRDLLYCLGTDQTGDDVNLRYTSMQRRKETHSKLHTKIRAEREIEGGLRAHTVGLPARSTLVFQEFLLYLRVFSATIDTREAVYHQPIFRKLRFTHYRLVQKSEAEFVKKVKMKYGEPKDTTIFLGDWSQSTAKFHAPSKTAGFRTMFKRARFNVMLVDESRPPRFVPVAESLDLNLLDIVLLPDHGEMELLLLFTGCCAAKAKIVNFTLTAR